jgi:hypothetical protein
MTLDEVMKAYLSLREMKDATKKRHSNEMALINEPMLKLQAYIQRELQAQGLTNFRGESGMAFLQTDTSVQVKDWDATFNWLRENDAWQFLEKRVSKSVVQDYIEAHGEIPPGLAISSEVSAHIRRS